MAHALPSTSNDSFKWPCLGTMASSHAARGRVSTLYHCQHDCPATIDPLPLPSPPCTMAYHFYGSHSTSPTRTTRAGLCIPSMGEAEDAPGGNALRSWGSRQAAIFVVSGSIWYTMCVVSVTSVHHNVPPSAALGRLLISAHHPFEVPLSRARTFLSHSRAS